MGVNYYAVKNKPTTEEPIHIGEVSIGRLFLFQDQKDVFRRDPVEWHTFEQVKSWLYDHVVDKKDYVILDEYDEEISFKDFFKMVENKQKNAICRSNPDNFKYNENIDGYRFSKKRIPLIGGISYGSSKR